jgi:methylthioribose-1-phosphate isomerase
VSELEPHDIVRLEEERVVLLDQRRLPGEEVELECRNAAEVAEAIRTLAIRGAPAIGIAAAYGYALAAQHGEDVDEADRVLRSSRPTAVNLGWALDRMREDPTPAHARQIHAKQEENDRRMAEHAVTLLQPGTRALTHCNTGALATAGYGTALGAIRLGHERGLVDHVWVTETRPLNQGSRLTAWELDRLGIPFAVIADSAVASVMEAGRVDVAFTGADRIAASGDTANKIGTYGLAVLARHHDVPFVVVAPTSTVDAEAQSGDAIPIEVRSATEVSDRFPAFNPAFDITPADLIDAIVTEEGVRRGAPVA